jgi:hypothetical protein
MKRACFSLVAMSVLLNGCGEEPGLDKIQAVMDEVLNTTSAELKITSTDKQSLRKILDVAGTKLTPRMKAFDEMCNGPWGVSYSLVTEKIVINITCKDAKRSVDWVP